MSSARCVDCAQEVARRHKAEAAAALAAHLEALSVGDQELAAATLTRFRTASERLKAAGATALDDAFREGRIPGRPDLEGVT